MNIGHNKPPFDAELWANKAEAEIIPEFARVYELLASLGRACEELGGEITNSEQADKLADFNKQFSAANRAVEDRRKSITVPLNEVVKDTNAQHKPFSELCTTSKKTLSDMYLLPWQLKEQKRIDEERRIAQEAKDKAEAEAAEAARHAEALKETASTGAEAAAAINAEFEANEAAEAAKAAKKEASTAKKQTAASGSTTAEGRRASVRTGYEPEVTNYELVFQKFGINDRNVKAALDTLAKSLLRSPDDRAEMQKRIAAGEDLGFKIIETKKVI